MKFIIVLILSVIFVVVSIQAYFILKERNQLKLNLTNLDARLDAILKENANLRSEIEYFSHPENLEKELRLKFNYKKPDEKMMIVVP